MKITYYGTSSSEGWPALFCSCKACQLARTYGGKNVRTRSQTLIDDSLLIDFPPDTNYHVQKMGLDLRKVKTLLITHSHHDHFFPYDICMRGLNFAEGLGDAKMSVYGNGTVESKFYEAIGDFTDVESYIEFHRIKAFQTICTADGYEVVSLAADHNPPEESLNYIIRRDGKSILYAHDTGIFPGETWEYLEGKHFDLVSLDCTALSRDWRSGHMGFSAAREVKKRLENLACIGPESVLVLNHFAHFGDYTHEKICSEVRNWNFEVAYDGCSFVI